MYTDLISQVHRCIIAAGKAILDVYNTDFPVETKSDESPITEADRQAHEIIKDGLSFCSAPGYTGLPFLSEEGVHTPFETRRTWKRYWLVDPLDGTKEFVSRNGEFTVNIALIDEGRPAAGFVYLPVKDILYWGIEGTGAFVLENAGAADPEKTDSTSKKLPTLKTAEDTLRIVASRSHLNPETAAYIRAVEQSRGKKIETVQAGSSLKLCRIAEGSAGLYPRFGPTMEWDTAAAHGVCRAAGCSVIDITTKEEMRYNKQNLKNRYFLACPADLKDRFLSLLENPI